MKDKYFFSLLILIGIIGILGIGLLLNYTLKLKNDSSIITIISTEKW